MVVEDPSHNIAVIEGWIDKRHLVAMRAVEALAPAFEGTLENALIPPLEV
jgi:hypothetical protein